MSMINVKDIATADKKGIELLSLVFLVIIGVIILVIIIFMANRVRGSVDTMAYETAVRQCCENYRNAGCVNPSNVKCRVPWQSDLVKLDILSKNAGITNINNFCNCP